MQRDYEGLVTQDNSDSRRGVTGALLLKQRNRFDDPLRRVTA
jgi:hypothetical protein